MSVSRTIHTEKIRTLTIKLIEICLLENAKKCKKKFDLEIENFSKANKNDVATKNEQK